MIICAGVGPGHLDFMTRGVAHHIANADVVAGFDAVVEIIRPLIPVTAQIVTMNYRDQVAQLKRLLANIMRENVASSCSWVMFTSAAFNIYSASSRRAGIQWTHGQAFLRLKSWHLVHVLDDQRNAIVTPRPWDFMPKDIACWLLAQGLSPDHPVEVWENLTRG